MNFRQPYILFLFLFFSCGLALRAAAIDYTVVLTGVDDEALRTLIGEEAMLYTLAARDPPSLAALRRRARNDVAKLETKLREVGHFGAAAGFEIDESAEPPVVHLNVDPGPLYMLGELSVQWVEGEPGLDTSRMGFEPGAIARPEPVLAVEQEIMTLLSQRGYPFPESRGRRLIVDHDAKTVDVALAIAPGPVAYFGPVEVTGFEDVDEEFIRSRIKWADGELFDMRKVAETRKRLINSGVIAGVDIGYVMLEGTNLLAMTLDVRERKHRSIGGGLLYSTAREFIAQVFWEHRNLFGQAEKLRTRLEAGTKTYGVSADFSKPDIFDIENLNWQVSGQVGREEVEAYEKEAAAISTTLNYQVSDHVSVSGGLWFEESRIREEGQRERDFTIAGVPLIIRYDNTDALLNPRQGLRLSAGVTPLYIINEQAGFLKIDLEGSHYWPLSDRFVWANRARMAFIEGQDLVDLPPDKRLYAGGGGSVRGYGHQMVGPLDENDNPVGGRTAMELGTEGRFMLTEKIEAVAFFEGGRVTKSINFDTDEEFLWSAGVGGRYHTAVGPVRVDIAVPFTRRDADDAYQFYVSLGQAF